MAHTTLPQGLLAPNSLVFPVVPAGIQPPPPGPLTLGVVALTALDLSTVTAASVLVRKPDGSTLSWAATYAAGPSGAVSGATGSGVPVVLTVPNSDAFNELVTVAGVGGNTAANGGPFYFQALSPTTIALFTDALFLHPVIGTGTYTNGGTVIASDSGTVTYALATDSAAQPVGDLDQIGNWEITVQLTADDVVVPCGAGVLVVQFPFASNG